MFVDKNSKDLLEIFFKTQRKFSQGVDVSDEIEIKRIITSLFTRMSVVRITWMRKM